MKMALDTLGKYDNIQNDDIRVTYNQMQNKVMGLVSRARNALSEEDYDGAKSLIGDAVEELKNYEEKFVDPKHRSKTQSPTYGLRKSINKMERRLGEIVK